MSERPSFNHCETSHVSVSRITREVGSCRFLQPQNWILILNFTRFEEQVSCIILTIHEATEFTIYAVAPLEKTIPDIFCQLTSKETCGIFIFRLILRNKTIQWPFSQHQFGAQIFIYDLTVVAKWLLKVNWSIWERKGDKKFRWFTNLEGQCLYRKYISSEIARRMNRFLIKWGKVFFDIVWIRLTVEIMELPT